MPPSCLIDPGESKCIIFTRALFLTFIGIALPWVSITLILLGPSHSPITTTTLVSPTWTGASDLPGNAAIALVSLRNSFPTSLNVTVSALLRLSGTISCPTAVTNSTVGATCTCRWSDIETITISLDIPLELGGVNVFIGCNSTKEACQASMPIPVLPGSRLFGLMTWSEQKTTPQEALPRTGRRPLSALGVVHLFQRRALVRRWHQDFPAIHTEGGVPGSDSAGIVAFIRERLVALEEYPQESVQDLEEGTEK
ncbi:hypothetical protein K438DRAFT_2059278 [Mycena galopus ATCC 62051]|nr:hypothetical protein K438DRAFT_2059278 [Mycena galopus ATCC 62051]